MSVENPFVQISKADYEELKKLYKEAVGRDDEIFIWKDKDILVDYAKYLIWYLQEKFERR